MANYRLLNEFGRSSVVLALEPAYRCSCHCTYCFAELAKRKPWAGRKVVGGDDGSFERAVEKAFGPDYDPSDFRQWALRNRLPLGFANTVEPFQDVPQARGILRVARALDLPLFIQTKGCNLDQVWSDLAPLAGNAALFVSFPTPDDRVLKRFEPGTPPAKEREALIREAAKAGFHVVLALAPYHELWCQDPAGFVREAASWGVQQVFFDRLRLGPRQKAAATDPATLDLAAMPWDDRAKAHAVAVYEAALDAEIHYTANLGKPIALGCHGTLPTLVPDHAFGKGLAWPYVGRAVHLDLQDLAEDDPEPEAGPLALTWDVALALMERRGRVGQEFSWASLRDLMAFKTLAPAWRHALGERAPMAAYYRALWNSPRKAQFAWDHPFARLAVRPDGSPWRDDAGDAVLLYSHRWPDRKFAAPVEDLGTLRFVTPEREE